MDRKPPISLLLATLALTALLASTATAAPGRDWPAWHGPNLDLTAPGDGVFKRPSFGLERAWVKPLGSAYSGIVVVGDRLVTSFSDGESDLLVALDAASGEEVWRYRISETYKGHDGSDDGLIATPTVAGGRVYGFSPWGHLFAVRLDDGKELWAKKLDEGLGAKPSDYGFAGSPAVVGGALVVLTGGEGGKSISAFDPSSGDLLWSVGDDKVEYQSPIAFEVGGETQVLAVTSARVLGLDPSSGEVLWQNAHPEDTTFASAQPIILGEGRMLLADGPGTVLYQVGKTDGSYEVREVWTTRGLRNSLTIPVPYEGHVYGYAGAFLTCVDAATGEVVWKSRPPGTGSLVLVDGHLVIQTTSGDVVVAEATPEGYREKARTKAMEKGYLTAPSFAGGRIYVRNLEEIAAIGVTDRATEKVAAAPALPRAEALGRLAEVVRAAEAAPDEAAKKKVIEDFLAAHESFPIVEAEGLVHFVYRGDVPDLAFSGNMLQQGDLLMGRVAGTDFYYASLELEPASHYAYNFAVFDERITDPRNPRMLRDLQGEVSEVTTPGFDASYLGEPEGPRGRLEGFTWKSEAMEDEREVKVYLPHGYDTSEARYPLLVVHYGGQMLENGKMANTLDNLIGQGEVAPVIAAFVPRQSFAEYAGGRAVLYADAVVEELLPRIDETYRTLKGPASRAAMGFASGASQSLLAAVYHPEAYGKVALQSFYFGEQGDAVKAKIAELGEGTPEVYLEIRRYDYRAGQVDAEKEGRELTELLTKSGKAPRVVEFGDGAGWGSWRARVAGVLKALFPKVTRR